MEDVMNDKRDAYINTRVTPQEMQIISLVARQLRRSRSDTLRILALEKAEELGLLPRLSPSVVVHEPGNREVENEL
jgi:uncharacterized protein (DUF1778 family)